MKRLLIFLTVTLLTISVRAQSIRIHLKDGSHVVYTSEQVDYVDFLEQGASDDTQESGEAQHNTEPRFSETVEMMCLIWRLAGANEYNMCRVPSIANSADSYFASMTNHEAVRLAREYWPRGIQYDAVTGYANQLIFDDAGRIIFDPDYQEGSNTSFDRWSFKQKQDMLAAVNDFYTASNFHDWFVSIQDKQAKAIKSFKSVCDLDYSWFDTFFGKNDKIASRIILSFLIGPNNNGISLKRADGTDFLTPTFGSFNENAGTLRFEGGMDIVVHEFSHPHCNPYIEAYWDSMSDMANKVFSLVEIPMSYQAYGNPKTMMFETFVRATTIRYLLDYDGDSQKESLILAEENNGFLLVRSLVDVLKEREEKLAEYPTMGSFMPELVKAINAFPVDELIDKMEAKEEVPDQEPETEGSTSDKNLLTGVFSVSPTKKVKFTKGNLYWDGSRYRLEDDQLSSAATWDPNHVSHFYWTNDIDIEKTDPAYQPYAESYPYQYPFAELSKIDKCWCSKERKISVDGTSGLYILSGGWGGEWGYLLEQRPNAANLRKYLVTVAGEDKCLIIAPDDYKGTIQSSYTAAEWQQAEKEGLICLVARGFRMGIGFNETDWGFYWSSTTLPFMIGAYKLLFSKDELCLGCDQYENSGMLIRLVKTISQ